MHQVKTKKVRYLMIKQLIKQLLRSIFGKAMKLKYIFKPRYSLWYYDPSKPSGGTFATHFYDKFWTYYGVRKEIKRTIKNSLFTPVLYYWDLNGCPHKIEQGDCLL
jgi:hypothetical protein